MNEFLNEIYLENTVKSYLIVAGVILVAYLLKRFLAKYVARIIYFFVGKKGQANSKIAFVDLVVKPLGNFLFALIAVVSLSTLQLPEILQFNIFRINSAELLKMIGSFVIIYSFFVFLLRLLDFFVVLVKDKYHQNNEPEGHQLFYFFKDLLKVVIILIGLMVVMKYTFNYDVKGLLTGLSIVGAAVALALKENLENLIASFIIFFDKPFKVGDYVKVNNVVGTVEKIGLRSTRVRSDAKTYITVPNKQMADGVVDNQSDRLQRKVAIILDLSNSTTPDKIDTLQNGVRKILTNDDIASFTTFFTDIKASGLTITIEYFTTPNLAMHNQIKNKVNMQVLQLLKELNIETAGNVTDIKIVTPEQQPPQQDVL